MSIVIAGNVSAYTQSEFESCLAGYELMCDKIVSEKKYERWSNMSQEQRESEIIDDIMNDPERPLYDILNSK